MASSLEKRCPLLQLHDTIMSILEVLVLRRHVGASCETTVGCFQSDSGCDSASSLVRRTWGTVTDNGIKISSFIMRHSHNIYGHRAISKHRASCFLHTRTPVIGNMIRFPSVSTTLFYSFLLATCSRVSATCYWQNSSLAPDSPWSIATDDSVCFPDQINSPCCGTGCSCLSDGVC